MLIGVSCALAGEICALIYTISANPTLWADQAPAVVVFAIGMLIPTLLVLDRLKTYSITAHGSLPRSFLICGFIAGTIQSTRGKTARKSLARM